MNNMDNELEVTKDSSAPIINPDEKQSEPVMTEEESAKKAIEEHSKKIVEAIAAGYEEAKKIAQNLSQKTLGQFMLEKDMARVANMNMDALKKTLRHLDRFGMIEIKVNGPSLQVKVNRHPEFRLNKLMNDREKMTETLRQTDVLILLMNEDMPKEETPVEDNNGDGSSDSSDIMAAVK